MPAVSAQAEIQRLMQALDALVNPGCCRGAGTSVFQVIDREGKPTGEEVRLCNNCGGETGAPGTLSRDGPNPADSLRPA
jgi:hypothetical protein